MTSDSQADRFKKLMGTKKKSGPAGVSSWLANQSEKVQKTFVGLVKEYIALRISGKTRCTLSAFVEFLQTEFEFPYQYGSMITYLKKEYPAEYKQIQGC